MESKLENLQKQVSLLKEENKNLKHKLKCKYMDKKNKLNKDLFFFFMPAILITIFTEIGYVYNLAFKRIMLNKGFEIDIYFCKITIVFISICVLLYISRTLYEKL